MGNREEALDLVEQSRKIDTNVNKKEYVDLLDAAIKKDSYYIEPYILLGFFYFKERDWDKALANLQKSVQIDYLLENNEETAKKVYITLGKVYQIIGNIEKSMHSFKNLIGLFPNAKASEKILKEIYSKLENRDEWFSMFKEGYNSYLSGKNEDALIYFKKSFGTFNNFSWAYYYNAKALCALGRLQRGISSFARAIELDEHFLFYYGLYETYELSKDSEKAKTNLFSTFSLNPLYPLILMEQCEQLHQNGETEKAERLLNDIMTYPELHEDLITSAKAISTTFRKEKPEEEVSRDEIIEMPPADEIIEMPPADEIIEMPPADEIEKQEEPGLHERKKRVEQISYEHVPGAGAELEKLSRKAREDADEIIRRAHEEAEAIVFRARQSVETSGTTEIREAKQKAEEERAGILARARKEAESIIHESTEKAETILAEAQQKSRQHKDSMTHIEEEMRKLEEEKRKLEEEKKKAEISADVQRSAEEERRKILEEAGREAEYILEEAMKKIEEEKALYKGAPRLSDTLKKEFIGITAEELRGIIQDETRIAMGSLRKLLQEELARALKAPAQPQSQETELINEESEEEVPARTESQVPSEYQEPQDLSLRRGRRIKTRLLKKT